MNPYQAVLFILALNATLGAQTSGVVIGTSYLRPTLPLAAPGQLTTFLLIGGPEVLQADASALPLPMSLSGVSAMLNQNGNTTPVPILSVHSIGNCNGSSPPSSLCNSVTAVTVEVPFQLIGDILGDLTAGRLTTIDFFQSGTVTASITVHSVTDVIHVITDCDALVPAPTGAPNGLCNPLITHADGSPILTKPAQPGETVIIYALGLGAVTSTVLNGAAATGPNPLRDSLAVNVGFTANSQGLRIPYPAITLPVMPYQIPAYAGLVPGSVGLYQVNVVIPPLPSGVKLCGAGYL